MAVTLKPLSAKTIGEIIAAVGVIGSMLFVGVQIRQNTASVRGATLQAIADAYTGFIQTNSLDPTYREVERLVFLGATPKDLTDDQNQLVGTNLIAWIGMLENTYVQNQLGLVSADVFEGYGWKRTLHHTPYFADWWRRRASLWVSPGFKRFFEARVQIGPRP